MHVCRVYLDKIQQVRGEKKTAVASWCAQPGLYPTTFLQCTADGEFWTIIIILHCTLLYTSSVERSIAQLTAGRTASGSRIGLIGVAIPTATYLWKDKYFSLRCNGGQAGAAVDSGFKVDYDEGGAGGSPSRQDEFHDSMIMIPLIVN